MKTAQWPAPGSVAAVVFDFDGVFTDNKVYLDGDGREMVRCDRGDGLGIDFLKKAKAAGRLRADLLILSTEPNPVVSARARKLGLECRQGVRDKLAFMEEFVGSGRGKGDPFRRVIFLGNDVNDVPLLRRAGFSVVPSDAHPHARRVASVVLPRKGGEGFVRAFVDRFLGLDKLSPEEQRELVLDR